MESPDADLEAVLRNALAHAESRETEYWIRTALQHVVTRDDQAA